jgi:uncharacterized protein with GYD domain
MSESRNRVSHARGEADEHNGNSLDAAQHRAQYRPQIPPPFGKEVPMPLYLTQVAYTQESWQALIKNPQDRIDAIRPAIKKLGGKVISGYFAFGDYDIVAITEMPDAVSAAAIAIAFAAGGACKNVKTTPLLTAAEGIEAMKKAANSTYKPITLAAAASAD